jgi:hypothetical protein
MMEIMIKYSVKAVMIGTENTAIVNERNEHPKTNLTQNAKTLYLQF